MLQDVIVALRTLVKRPGYAASVILTLTLGISASTMMFSLLDAAMLKPLPFADPDRLLMLVGVAGPDRVPRGASFPEVLDWRSMNHTLTDVSIYDEISLNLRRGAETVRVDAEMVSASYFPLLGARAELGRTFLPDEDATPDAHPVGVISHKLWTERLGAARDVFDTPLFLNDRQFTIVGVMPDGFTGLSSDTDVWVPSMMVSLTSSPDVVRSRGHRWLGALGRLKDGTTHAQAQLDLDRVAALLERTYPDTNTGRGVQVVDLKGSLLGTTGTFIAMLFGAVLLFLTIACANVASLQLARTMTRRRELALRLALGAGRWRVLRHLLAESSVLALLAGMAGALLAAWGVTAASTLMPEGALPTYVHPAVDLRALGFALLAASLSGAVVAILPAVMNSGRDLVGSMTAGGRAIQAGIGSIRRPSAQQLLVVGEMALAMTLLTGAGLVARSLERELRVPVGFDPSNITVARVTLPPGRYTPAQRVTFVERLNEQLQSLPEARGASVSSDLPFTGQLSAGILYLEGDEAGVRYYRHYVMPEFFHTLGIALLDGRTFTAQDRVGAPSVAIVSASAARRLWGDPRRVVGRTFRLGSTDRVEVVGVAADARFRDLRTDITLPSAAPDVYFPYTQRTDSELEIAVRSTANAQIGVASLQQAVAAIDRGLPVYAVRLLDDALAQQTATVRLASGLLAAFSAGALLLAAIGLYGLISYIVGLSGREIGIRLALGADGRRVVLQILGNGLVLILSGIVVGGAAALLTARTIEAQLYQPRAADPVMLAGVALMLAIVAAAAILLPARRAARINPSAALRAE